MNHHRVFGLSLIGIVAVSSIPLAAQKTAPASQPSAIAISVSLKKDKIPVGEEPVAVFTMKNISSAEAYYATDPCNYRVRVEGEHGEPPLTMYQCHKRGIYLPGDAPMLRCGGVTVGIAPGASRSWPFDLSKYYHFTEPGKYTVFIEYVDNTGNWFRTNTVTFEMIEANR